MELDDIPLEKRFLNVSQAAAYLGVSAASLRLWSDQGKVPVYRTPGGQRRYRVSDLDGFMESMLEPGAPSPDRSESPTASEA
jgi:excisionase family DNA binding protein